MNADRDISLDEDIIQAKTKAETDKKCPACGGAMSFDPGTGNLLCPYCGYSEEIPGPLSEEDATVKELDFDAAEQTANYDWGADKKTVICKSCGAESIYDALQMSGVCPYCGSNQVTEEKAVDSLAPGGVCTFMLSAKEAGERFHKWIKRKLFTPRKAKQSAKPEGFQGVYLPYWTFDTDTDSRYTARFGRDRQVKDRNGNTRTVTDWYPTSGAYSEFIDDELVNATTRYDETIMDRIEPFNSKESKPYRPEYVAGFISERYSIGLKDGWTKAKEQISSHLEGEIESEIRTQHHADHVSDLRVTTVFSQITYKYLLLPVWISSFRYKEKIYQFMVNGQTGKVGGRAPVSPLRVIIACVIGIAVVALIAYLSRG